ncbi:MAG: heavy-metal-associated domain-containing protein [Clostridia bacterium]|nr:heavy-metal-associated domain-containing protein [Clostridia bacterium]
MIKYVFSVEGMMCCNCERHAVEGVKKACSSLKSVVASHSLKTVEVTSKKPIDTSVIKQAIENVGYSVLGVTEEVVEKKGLFR